ncbi:MAG: helix-turn-helix transcriptional regulator [Candidatus Omnitrophica bacterium]|nr:helix-turn-helix transcriptional regulator [Candidatus Omnitrophota bacterium]
MIRFGNTIKRLRKAKNLTLTDISKASGIPLATLRRIESGKFK